MKNSRLQLRNLVMYCDVSLVHHQHFVNHVILRKRLCLVAKEDHPFKNGYDKLTLSYEKKLPNFISEL